MKAGDWNVKSKDNKMKFNTTILNRNNMIFFLAGKRVNKVTSGLVPGAKEVVHDKNLRPGENKPD